MIEPDEQCPAYSPKLTFRGVEIPFLGEYNCLHFRILGRQFAVNVKDSSIREFVKAQVLSVLDKIDKDVIAPNIKLEILKKSIQLFLLASFGSWYSSILDRRKHQAQVRCFCQEMERRKKMSEYRLVF